MVNLTILLFYVLGDKNYKIQYLMKSISVYTWECYIYSMYMGKLRVLTVCATYEEAEEAIKNRTDFVKFITQPTRL